MNNMEKEKNIVKDFGEWNVPTKWEQITLKQFSDIRRYMSDKEIEKFDVRALLHILTNHTEDEVDQLPVQFSENILTHLMFLHTEPKIGEPTNKLEINGETYQINFQEQMRLGEYVAVDGIIKADKYDYPSILAVLCRKEGELFDSKFEAEQFEKRREMYEKLPMLDGMRLMSFFFLLLTASQKLSQPYLKSLEEEINHTAKLIERSTKIGALRKLYLNWQMKKLRKSLKSSKSI